MNKVYYLEPDEEITKVIDRIRKSDESGVVLVVSRGSTIAQSIINLKLISRNAAEHGKTIGIVSTDRITKNLAEQLKIPIFAKAAEAEKATLTAAITKPVKEAVDDDIPVKVNTYRKYDLSQLSTENKADVPVEDEADLTEEAAEAAMVGDLAVNDDENPELDEQLEAEDEEEDAIVPTKLQKAQEKDREPAREPARPKEERRTERKREDKPVEASELEAAEEAFDSDDYALEEVDGQEEREEFHHSALPIPELRKEENMSPSLSGNRHSRNKARKKIIAFVSVLILIILLGVSFVFLPHAEATVLLKTADLDKKTTFTIDQNQKETDIGNLAIPGQLVELEKDVTKTFNSTGKKDAGAKASGTITISNTTVKNVPVSPNTKVTTVDGKIFYTTAGVMAPAGKIDPNNCKSNANGTAECAVTPGTVDAAVTAAQNGETYNLSADVSLTAGTMTAVSKAAFTGGITKNINYVTEDDLKNAEIAIKASALTDNQAELLTKASSASLKVIDKYISSDIISIAEDKNANDTADTFQATAKMKLSVLGFSEDVLKAATIKLINGQLASGQMLVNPDKSETTYAVSDYNADTGIMKVTVEFKGKTGAKLSQDALLGKIKSSSVNSATSYLEAQNGVDTVTVKSWPTFLHRMPVMASKIKITFDYQK